MNNNYESHAISRRSFLKASGVVGAAGILAACGGNSGSSSTAASSGATSAPNTTGATPLKEFISWESTNRELESWNMLYSQMTSDMNVTTNLWEGLLSFDCYGKAVPSVAKEWSHNEDSSVWTFNLRDDVDWVDVNGEVKAHLTSKDFLVGLEWVLNAAKNQANNTSMPNETLTGAADYYQKTSDMGDAAADLTYQDMLDAGVGVEAPDDYTLVFTCKDSCPYFDTVASYTSFYPASQVLIDELGIKCRIRSVPYPMLDIIARSMERFGDKTAKEPAFTHYGVSKLNFDFTLDITRAQDELGYQPVVTLDDGIVRTAAWLRDHGKLHR
jgi:oligopeptide transport system substrate-binding protein